MEDLILKMDMIKAYGRVNWTFLKLMLLQIGLTVDVVNWIMECVESINYGVLINGSPINSFRGTRGVRQGFPLSPLLFLIIIEGLSRLIVNSKDRGDIIGIKISTLIRITHLLFLDDVLISGIAHVREWKNYKRILDIFVTPGE